MFFERLDVTKLFAMTGFLLSMTIIASVIVSATRLPSN